MITLYINIKYLHRGPGHMWQKSGKTNLGFSVIFFPPKFTNHTTLGLPVPYLSADSQCDQGQAEKQRPHFSTLTRAEFFKNRST